VVSLLCKLREANISGIICCSWPITYPSLSSIGRTIIEYQIPIINRFCTSTESFIHGGEKPTIQIGKRHGKTMLGGVGEDEPSESVSADVLSALAVDDEDLDAWGLGDGMWQCPADIAEYGYRVLWNTRRP
jgi:hypothetical protein